MKKILSLMIISALFCANEAIAQKLVFTRNGMVSSENPLSNYVEYAYKNGVTKMDLKSYCTQCLAQPEYFSYRVDYVDDYTFKMYGYIKDNLKGESFALQIYLGEQSVKVSVDLFDKKGKNFDYERFFKQQRGVISTSVVNKFKSNVDNKIDGLIRSMLEMKTIIR